MESLMERKLRNLWKLWKDWNERRISGDFAMHQISTVFWGDIKKEDARQRLLAKSVPLKNQKETPKTDSKNSNPLEKLHADFRRVQNEQNQFATKNVKEKEA